VKTLKRSGMNGAWEFKDKTKRKSVLEFITRVEKLTQSAAIFKLINNCMHVSGY
jgi:hypothetical protein